MFNIVTQEIKFGEQIVTLETGKIARQATGSVVVKQGNTTVLCTVVGNSVAKDDIDFFPLTVNYFERYYAAGRYPGGFNKREARPAERETLISRLIDRPIRPLFPAGFFNEVQIVCTTLSYDPNHQPDILAIIGASAALEISGIPFSGPIAAARVGYANGEYILNPSSSENPEELSSELDLIVAGTKDAVLMVESEAKELSEDVMLGAVIFGHKAFLPVIDGIAKFAKKVGKKTWEFNPQDNSEIAVKVAKIAETKLSKAFKIALKSERYGQIKLIQNEVINKLVTEEGLNKVAVNGCFKALESKIVRNMMIKTKTRIDGRAQEDIRPIIAEVDVLPADVVHGSALFTRGETQALATLTLGSGADQQLVDDIEGQRDERFMLHYNFPPYSVGEAGAMRAPGRREIGHGRLARRALGAVLPTRAEFPYTIRVVSEITESNGSSSMASVCGASLAMMAAGVPLSRPVAGIAMGLIMEEKDYVVLSDIMGDEDHLGDMDFKVAGTQNGVTALQMDIKIAGITEEVMDKALHQAKTGRLHILKKMADAIEVSRDDLSSSAPRIVSIQIKKEKIGELIGPGGKMIKSITEQTGAKIDISDEGLVNISSSDGKALEQAIQMVKSVVLEPEIGQVFTGKVTRVLDFGVVVGLTKTMDGMVHVSEMAETRIPSPSSLVSEGDIVTVKILDIEKNGRIKLTMKGLNKNLVVTDSDNNNSDEVDSVISKETERQESKSGSRFKGKKDRNDRDFNNDTNRNGSQKHGKNPSFPKRKRSDENNVVSADKKPSDRHEDDNEQVGQERKIKKKRFF